MSNKPKIFGHLVTGVVRKNLCVGCGACEAVCPVNSIQIVDVAPKLVGLCIACGMCYSNCPQVDFDVEGIEKEVFGRVRGEDEAEIGVYKAIYAVQTKEKDIQARSQDGGAVTAILSQFLTDGGECAVVAGFEEGKIWIPTPTVAHTRELLVESAGTKYTPSPTLVGVSSAIKEYQNSRVAVVGTPCQMRALRKIETGDFSDAKIADATSLNIGLFCMETFNRESFMEFLEKEGIDATNVTKFDIKSGRFIAWQDEEAVYDVKLSKVKELVRPCCEACNDFAAEFSDLSVGNVGSPDGWSTVIVRTDRGETALMATEKSGLIEVKPIDEVKPGLKIVYRLAKLKRKEKKK